MPEQIELSEQQRDQFNSDGFVVIESVLTTKLIESARDRFEKLFAGVYETGLQPDEHNWLAGRDDPSLTRQICNAWKSDRTIASIVLREDIGSVCASLRHWPGARINQDNVIWKPPGAKALGFHQDDSYQNWIVPSEMMTCWITLDDTYADQGTIEYVRGSHQWPISRPIEQFHAPNDPLSDMQQAADVANKPVEIIPIEVPAGSVVLHHGKVWHGSRTNSGNHQRRSVVSHCMSSDAQFHSKHVSAVYSRYRQQGSLQMDESFFPILWSSNGYRSSWVDSWLGKR